MGASVNWLYLVSQVDSAGMSHGLDQLIRRVGYIEFFAAVINHVPNVVPYTRGEIWADAIARPFMPRMLVRGKIQNRRFELQRTCILASMNWVPKRGTSISIGYMGETYIDFGPVWMMPVIAGFGYFLGRIYR